MTLQYLSIHIHEYNDSTTNEMTFQQIKELILMLYFLSIQTHKLSSAYYYCFVFLVLKFCKYGHFNDYL